MNGVDVLRDMRLFLEDLRHIGFSGVHNFPTVAWFDGEFRRTLEGTGLGYGMELEMLHIARELDLLTIGYAFNEEDTERLMTEAAPDIFIFHAGITRGGSTGYAGGSAIEETATRTQRHYDIATADQARRDPAGARRRAGESRRTRSTCSITPDCHGVQLGSSIERMAIEVPLQERAAAFKQVHFARARASGAEKR